jgi:hypothetical protein
MGDANRHVALHQVAIVEVDEPRLTALFMFVDEQGLETHSIPLAAGPIEAEVSGARRECRGREIALGISWESKPRPAPELGGSLGLKKALY